MSPLILLVLAQNLNANALFRDVDGGWTLRTTTSAGGSGGGGSVTQGTVPWLVSQGAGQDGGAWNVSLSGVTYPASTGNNSTANLAAGATFTGTPETIQQQQAAQVSIWMDQPYTVNIDQCFDSACVFVLSTDTYTRSASTGFNENIILPGDFFRLRVQNTGASATTSLRIGTTFGIMPATPRGPTNLGNARTALNEVNGTAISLGQTTMAASLPVAIASNQSAITVAQGTAANLNATVTGTVAATQSGTWTVQPGNTANTTPWLVTSRVVGNTGAVVDAANNATAPANVLVAGAQLQSGAAATNGTAGQVGSIVAGLDHVLYARLGGPVVWSCFVPLTTTATTQCQAAPAAGLRAYVTSMNCSNGAATVQGVDIVFGTGANCGTGTTALTHKYQMGTNALTTSPFQVYQNFGTGLVPTAANAICVRPTAATAFGCTLTGFTAP